MGRAQKPQKKQRLSNILLRILPAVILQLVQPSLQLIGDKWACGEPIKFGEWMYQANKDFELMGEKGWVD